ncbi:hypothetical protein SFRURICE_010700 [Spodoptera frugiperda]|nr:hypothetical protein SFRURICE_010700 [Spodoptera frugiperda]
MANFDTERFIIEVENRRGLWDLESNDYSNKDVKRQLWLELVDIFGGESMEDKEKAELEIFGVDEDDPYQDSGSEYLPTRSPSPADVDLLDISGAENQSPNVAHPTASPENTEEQCKPRKRLRQPSITLQKRWKNLRDCFTRELRRLKDVKSGSAAKRKSQYTYFNQLLFLKSVLDTNATENSLEEASQENKSARSSDLETQQSASKSLRTKRKKKMPNEESDTDPLISVLQKTIATTQNDSNCDRLFLLSLLERFQTIPAAMKTKNGNHGNYRKIPTELYTYNSAHKLFK